MAVCAIHKATSRLRVLIENNAYQSLTWKLCDCSILADFVFTNVNNKTLGYIIIILRNSIFRFRDLTVT
jgi:hypothetical protein